MYSNSYIIQCNKYNQEQLINCRIHLEEITTNMTESERMFMYSCPHPIKFESTSSISPKGIRSIYYHIIEYYKVYKSNDQIPINSLKQYEE